jgi:hypothetical protein
MLVGGTYQFVAGADQKAGLKRFQAWQPPAGFTFQGHWATADGMGGIFIAEVDSAAATFEAAAAFADMAEFHIVPVLDINESVPISARVFDWIDSVS